jgi:Family of unknown function (DUF5329)
MKFFRSSLLILIASLAFVSPAKSAESLDQTISYLIDCVANSKATFIRNGTSYTSAEAAEHIKAKYAHFKKDIRTPEDFIRLSASKSILSGKPYLVRLPDGKAMHLDAWLTDALKQHRSHP